MRTERKKNNETWTRTIPNYQIIPVSRLIVVSLFSLVFMMYYRGWKIDKLILRRLYYLLFNNNLKFDLESTLIFKIRVRLQFSDVKYVAFALCG